jgi:hypothetical protein
MGEVSSTGAFEGSGLTVNRRSAVLLPLFVVAVMVTEPSPLPVTTPSLLTVDIAVLF